ncbi:hypothetical protein T492DRAFT_1050981 [Pavlovales sp. CCMP2436]|nr:hypothetical protein T492DRAFT_1050981 [Pavlovales sp. CCMP2436]
MPRLAPAAAGAKRKIFLPGSSPLCVRLCLARVPASAALKLQPGSPHGYGRSPLCVRLCVARVPT